MSHTYIQSRSSSSRTVLLLSNIGCMYDQRWPHGPEDDRSSSIQAIDGLIGSMLKKYNWRPDSEIEMLKIANRNNGIPVLHDSISGSGWDLISGGKKVGEIHGL